MNWTEMNDAVEDAERTSKNFDNKVQKLAGLLVGRLRRINGWGAQSLLSNLKNELKEFNAKTGEWKS